MKKLKEIYYWFKEMMYLKHTNPEFKNAKSKFLASNDESDTDKILLNKVVLKVHFKDTMYKTGKAEHYLSVGLSAMSCIEEACNVVGASFNATTILDFACGYGRVLRFLRAAYPNSEITVAEINNTALRYCQKNFQTHTFLSDKKFEDLNISNQFDLIWCGSLFTHIDELSTFQLLTFFYNHLQEKGICIFSTHGQHSIDLIQSKKQTYGMNEIAQIKVVEAFQLNGYGYSNYNNQEGYGISIIRKDRITDIAEGVGSWKLILFKERGWDHHQDVYAFQKITA